MEQIIPFTGIRRRVIFSMDQLVVSFGGAIGLFLGASFVSVSGLIIIFIKYLMSKCGPEPRRNLNKTGV